jgi:protein-S-isoprenylcysteine O-methyltransferase
MAPSDLAYAVMALLIVSDSFMRRGGKARSLSTGPSDRKTTLLIGIAYTLALVGGRMLPRVDPWLLPIDVAWAGLGVLIAGAVFRAWAMITLGRFYTRTLQTTADQTVVDRGPYALVRHPGYFGALVVWTGLGLASTSAIVAVGAPLLMTIIYGIRIRAEERMLVESIGEPYRAYQSRTRRLIPFVY